MQLVVKEPSRTPQLMATPAAPHRAAPPGGRWPLRSLAAAACALLAVVTWMVCAACLCRFLVCRFYVYPASACHLPRKEPVPASPLAEGSCCTLPVPCSLPRASLHPLYWHQGLGMGSSSSKSAGGSAGAGWQPSQPGAPRKISGSGYDITPLTVEERIAAAAPLTDFQRHVALQARRAAFWAGPILRWPLSPGVLAACS